MGNGARCKCALPVEEIVTKRCGIKSSMARSKSGVVYVCQQCGEGFPKWQGQCGVCGVWNSLVETRISTPTGKKQQSRSKQASERIVKLSELEGKGDLSARLEVGSGELKQVLGGGVVQGSVVLLAGEPGIGKSTLLSQLTLYFASKHGKVLYVCGEESADQVRLRLERLSAHKKTGKKAKEQILLLPETDTDNVIAAMESERPVMTIVDSIQSLSTGDLSGMAGSVGQVRESGNRILNAAKRGGLSTFIVGHVTKAGSIAGPKVLEHMVDAVLNLSGERSGSLRILKAMKNRFGAVDEVGVFEMRDTGLTDVSNPSGVFLEEAQVGVPGACVTVVMEGTRPILAEIQALVVESSLSNPRRVAGGIKLSRLQVICAVLEKRVGLRLGEMDVFVNVAGGMKIIEPAADLAVALAIASSVEEKAVPKKTVAIGEVGLLGEVRRVSFVEKRVKEAKKLGFGRVLGGEVGGELGKMVKFIK